MIKINEQVPDFEVDAYHNNEIKKVKLSDYRGKWVVLVFYPADFTFVCPTELEDMQKYYEDFKKNNVEVMSISTDTAYVHKAWHDSSEAISKIEYPMFADPAGKVSRMFGVYLEDEGVALRGTFIIDPDGILKAMEVNNNDIGRNAAETLRKVEAAKFVGEHPGNVCPASWKPGDETLKPGIDLIGKI